jgi:hypothetical protein
MTQAIRIYQYIAPALLTPLSFYLWWNEYQNIPQVLVAWLIPVLWAYIVPGIGTNLCKVWEFDVRWKLGRFRPHHGFVFGSTTAMITWLIHGDTANGIADVLRFAVILCSVLGFWNLLYEIQALRIGVLKVYNQPWADGSGEEAVALDYAPWFFGGFGAVHGLVIGFFEYLVHQNGLPDASASLSYLLLGLVLCIAVPVSGFVCYSLRTHGHAGVHPVAKEKSS